MNESFETELRDVGCVGFIGECIGVALGSFSGEMNGLIRFGLRDLASLRVKGKWERGLPT